MIKQITISPPTAEQEAYLRRIEEASRQPTEKELENILIPGPNFDPDFSPYHSSNQQAAKARNWRYDPKRRCYCDADGAMVADRFGQRY